MDDLRRLAEAARDRSPSPWRATLGPNPGTGFVLGPDAGHFITGPLDLEIADYIAAAHPDRFLALLDRLAAAESQREALDVERRFFTLYAKAHQSDLAGMRAGVELQAWAEDWFDANTEEGWSLPRISRAALKEQPR